MRQMSELAELMSFLTLTCQAKLITQSTEQTFKAHLNAKADAQAWLQRMAAGTMNLNAAKI